MTWGARYGWAAPGIRSVFDRLKNVPMGTLPWVEKGLLAGRTVLLRSADDLPPEADDLRQLWEEQSLRSALMVPLRGRGALVRGCLALFSVSDGPSWEHQDVRQVEQVGEAIANVLERKHVEDSLRASDEQLRQSQKMEAVGQLAGGIAHDFNNLLTVILGYSEMILTSGTLSLGDMRPDVEEIKAAAERASALTGQILAFSRRQALQPTVVSLNDVLAVMEPLLRRTLGEDIDLISFQGADIGNVEVDVHQFEQVLMNLALNARDAMVSGGRLTVETANAELDEEYCRTHPEATPGSFVMLAVSDTGVGMDGATIEHIFEPFFTTKAPGEGTGLGLATVYGVVRQSNGSISVYSQPGKGTSFKIYLPRATAPLSEETRVTIGGALARGDETILVVEDESALRSLIARVLGSLGYTTHLMEGAGEALALIADASQRIDLLLTDVVLPGAIQGNLLAERALALCPSLPVIYMSGYAHKAITHAGRLDEGVNFLGKPFTPETLAIKVREVLDASAPAT
jgi:two-component system cell cycle sensor histidine kinase/response regulator CckA